MQKPNLLIATPAYGSMVTLQFAKSLLQLGIDLSSRQVPFYFHGFGNESLVPRARNAIVAYFLGSPAFTHLLFIDGDISFSSDAVVRLVEKNKEVVGGCYPKKGLNWTKVRKHIQTEPLDSSLISKSLNYVVNPKRDNGQDSSKLEISPDGFAPVENIGSGFLLIQRNVFSKLKKAYPELQYQNDIPSYESPETKGNFWLFFDTMIQPKTKRYLSEDFAFCERWRAIGGEIWMDIRSPLQHIGAFVFPGDIHQVVQHAALDQGTSN